MSESLGVDMWPGKIRRKVHREKDFPALRNQQRSAAGFKFVPPPPVSVIENDPEPTAEQWWEPAESNRARRFSQDSRYQRLLEILHELAEAGSTLPTSRVLGEMIDVTIDEPRRSSVAQQCLQRLLQLGLIRMWVGSQIYGSVDKPRAVTIVSTGAVLRNQYCPPWLLP